jgi:SAM-dependent methyltransferase
MERNRRAWDRKPVLRSLYRNFHERIAAECACVPGPTVELGSGIGGLRSVIPDCILTDIEPGPGIDRVETAYALTFDDASIANLIMIDVFHHLRYPGTALDEACRALAPGGRLVIFDTCTSFLGNIVYGLLHDEPLGASRPIAWAAPPDWDPSQKTYYAQQSNAPRVFLSREYEATLETHWRIMARRRYSAISYVLSGGYSKPRLYPEKALPLMRALDRICDKAPKLFATRLLVVLEKRG